MDLAFEWVCKFMRIHFGSTHRPVALSEAKCNLDGGVGLPYKYSSLYKYKQDFVNLHPDFHTNIDFSKIDRYSLMWDCFPKVEILAYDKAQDKTRIICGAPVEHFLVGAMLHSSLNLAMTKGGLVSKCAMGIRTGYRGWHELYEFLPDLCENSDATRFDKSISPKLLKYVYLIRERLMIMNGDERKMFWWYYEHLVHRRSYLSNGPVYDVYGGNGSGQYNTSTDNTIAHLLCLAYAHVSIGNDYSDFSNCKQVVYGDDYIGEAMPSHYWDHFIVTGIKIKKTPIMYKDSCDFLSSTFSHTPYGVANCPKTTKGVYSMYTSENKRWREFRPEKLYSLWLNYFFSEWRFVFERALCACDIEFNTFDAYDFHFGWMVDLKSLSKMSKKGKKKNLAVQPLSGTIAAAIPQPPRRPVVPNRLRMRNRQMVPNGILAPVSTVQMPDLTHKLSEQDETFFRNILNPCDEKSGPSSGSKIPDGTLPNSGVNGFREVFNVAPPFPIPSEPGPIGGPLWSLIIMKLPTIREAIYLIATNTRDDLSVDDQVNITNAYNAGLFTEFPNWYTIPENNGIMVSVVIWSQLRSISDMRTLFKQVRISKSGFTTFHNAPDLYNQGMLITAQWNCDDVNKGDLSRLSGNRQISRPFVVNYDPAGGSGGTLSGGVLTLPNGVQVQLTQVSPTRVETQILTANTIGGVGQASLAPGAIPQTAPTYTINDEIVFYAELTSPNPPAVLIQFGYTYTNVINGNVRNQLVNVPVPTSAGVVTRDVNWLVNLLESTTSAIDIELPPLDTQSIIQSTPKAVVYPMKQYNGGYTPLRFWEPVFLMQEANTQSAIHWRRRGESAGVITRGSQDDIIDLNFGTAVQACMGLSLAASITVKVIQDIEFVAGDGSPWMGFMNPNTNVDTQVISLARAVTLQTPFAYPQTFNSAGILGGLLSQFVSHIPILSNLLPIVSKVVGSLFPQNNSSEPHPELDVDKVKELLNHVLSSLLNKKFN